MIEEIAIEASKNPASIWVPIFMLFAWLLKWTMTESKKREDRSHEREKTLMQHNEMYQKILQRQSELLDQQNHVHKGQSEQLKELTGIIHLMKNEMINIKERVTELWNKKIS